MATELEVRQRLKDNFPFYARNCLQIRTKAQAVQPLVLNDAQAYIHDRLEAQREETGKVRAIILKGRQQGCSTYTEARFYWRTTHNSGVRTFILTHEDAATANLFEMVERYHSKCPPLMKPATGASNAKELSFPGIDSGYKVGTAGNKAVGRSSTIQYFHGSEVAFWPNADEHVKGILQAVPDLPGTEVILESTANGMGNYFHQQWKLAEAGLSDYIAVFVPWYWQREYRAEGDFVATEEELELAHLFGLDHGQVAWRRRKIRELSTDGTNGERAFKQEYPMHAAEAFQITGKDGLITPDVVLRARSVEVRTHGPLIVGVDPSRGGDRFSVIRRQHRKAYGLQSYKGDEVDNLGKQVAICKRVLDTTCPVAARRPDMMFVDAGGGAELVDRLHELGYEDRVRAVHFGAYPFNPELYKNKRAEMWGEINLWLRDEHLPVELPDSDSLHADLCVSFYSRDTHDRIVLWPKDKIKEKCGFSPDEGDALALTFAEPASFFESLEDSGDEADQRGRSRVTGY